ncbi:T9SS C-terminal target domain-containing protein [Sphingobacteriales bacterium UPWRP_1]|nr:hypothetical protein BVG80_12215 [Sphingobacteriales bacterium TSM_CSM]PSJ75830.1 T9SS C-terminal target domain-containing protein [Sphingobacteriales bacterium UPWRP_1]
MIFSVYMRAQTVSLQQSPASSAQFLINFELPQYQSGSGVTPIADDGCELTVYVVFRFYDINDVLLEEIEKTIEVYSNEGNLPFFSTKDFMYNYSIKTCNINTHYANIYIYACGDENCFLGTVLVSLNAALNGSPIAGEISSSAMYNTSCDLSDYLIAPDPSYYVISIEQIPVTPATIPLNADIYKGLGICSNPMVQQIYAVPSGGCPPYEVTWYNNLGQQITPFAPLNYFASYSFASFIMPASIPEMIAATPGNYTVVITDWLGATVSIPYTLTAQAMTSDLYYFPGQIYVAPTATTPCYVQLGIGNVYASYLPTYLWNNGSSTYNVQVNTTGSYAVTVTYANGCTAETNAYTVDEEDFFIPNVIADGNGEYRITAGTTEVWNSNKTVNATVVIESGATMTIDNANIDFLGLSNAIHVLNGGILRINHATLETADCNLYWQGIRVDGNWNIDHPSDYYTNGSLNHGTVIIGNGTQIANAWVGVHAYDMADVVGTNMGGGIVHIDGGTNWVSFTDNATDVQLDRFYGLQHGIIKKCVFNKTNTTYFAAYSGSNNEHLVLNRCGNVFIYDNQFQNLSTQHLTRIKAVNTNVTIGIDESGNTKPNKFTNFSNGQQTKGIDIYNTLTAASVTNVIGNEFNNIQKCITLNNVPFPVINANIFNLPAGSSSPNDVYGIYALKSFGFEFADNIFTTEAINDYTRAMVVNKSFFSPLAIATVQRNQFTGAFTDATRFEDDCQSLQLNCNVYVNAPQRDWYIAPYAKLDKQGECNLENTERSFHQHWHYLPAALYTGYNHYHVYNDNPNFTLEIYHDDYEFSVPTYNLGYVDKYSCSFELSTPIGENPSCTISVPPYNDGSVGCSYSGEELSRKIRNWQRAEENDSIIALLHCIAEDWSYKILVGTYIDRRMYTQALAALDSIPNTPQGNADFKAIYYAYIQLLTGGSGKNSDAAFALQQTEQNRTHAQQTLAESMFALLYGNIYLRTVQDKAAHNTPFSSKPTFILAPNPTNNSAAIYWHNALVVSSDVFITDIAGRVLKTYHNLQNGQQINTDNLPNGIYYVHAAALSATQKLVVVH